uniref:Uncharacterized protein n=1 Tax=Bactrocera latifrons TaxID=174628 RepID=A0A0K8VLS8_BACLA
MPRQTVEATVSFTPQLKRTNVAEVVCAPPATGRFDSIKSQLIKDFTDSGNKKLNRMVKVCDLGYKKPSQLLRQMRLLSIGALNDNAIKTYWLDKLPKTVRAVMSIAEADLDRCAQQDDKIMEIGNFSSVSTFQGQQS